MRDAVGALVVCVRAPEPSSSDKDTDPIEREDVRAIRELMRDVAAVKSCIDEERGGMGDVPGVLILVGSRKSVPVASSKDEDALELGVGDDGLGEDAAPLSVGWWEDQMFDMGLFGWEVIEWDPTEQGEVTRNKFGGVFFDLFHRRRNFHVRFEDSAHEAAPGIEVDNAAAVYSIVNWVMASLPAYVSRIISIAASLSSPISNAASCTASSKLPWKMRLRWAPFSRSGANGG